MKLYFLFLKSQAVAFEGDVCSSDQRECDLRWWYAEAPSMSGRRLLHCGMKVFPSAVSTCCYIAASNLEFTRDRPGPLALTPKPHSFRYLNPVQQSTGIWWNSLKLFLKFSKDQNCKGLVGGCEPAPKESSLFVFPTVLVLTGNKCEGNVFLSFTMIYLSLKKTQIWC